MPIFSYKAKDKQGKITEGRVDAPSESVAAEVLTEKGLDLLVLTRAAKVSWLQFLEKFLNRISARDLVIFTRQLSVMISANVPLVQALRVMVRQTSNEKLRVVLADIANEVDGGARLSQALSHFPQVFDELFVNIVKSGETSGRLDEVLNYLADEEEKDYNLYKKIQGIMIYPLIIFGGLLIVGGLMIILAVPKLVAFFREADVELPLATRALIAFSDFLVNYWWLVILLIVVIALLLRVYLKTDKGGRQLDYLKLKLPAFGKLYQKIYLVRFARSLATLISGGVRITNSLKISAGVVKNKVYYDLIMRTAKEVEDGNSISVVFSQSKDVPLMVSQMLVIGEETGKVDQVLDRMASFYAREIDNMVDNLVSLIGPIVIIFMGILVLIIFAAVILPMYQLAGQI